MLEDYFQASCTLHQLRIGPLEPYMDELSEKLKQEHYSHKRAKNILHGAAHFSRYLFWQEISDASKITLDHINDFLKKHLATCNCWRSNAFQFSGTRSAMSILIPFLQEKGFLPVEKKVFSADSIDGTLIRYEKYLRQICGLTEKSIEIRIRAARLFLYIRLEIKGDLSLNQLSSKDAFEIISILLERRSNTNWKRVTASCVRGFLRFLFWDKIIPNDLGYICPQIYSWKLQNIPQALTEDQLEQLLKSPDRSTSLGKRDYAILVLLSTLGLRASEVVALQFEHIHWRKRSLTIPAQKCKREREIPLPDIALHALQDYITNGRPDVDSRNIFIRNIAPLRELAHSGAIKSIVIKHVEHSKIIPPGRIGPHMLRHTLATFLVNEGVPFKNIADLLGHVNLDTTRIYAKTDMHNLQKVVVPFPSF